MPRTASDHKKLEETRNYPPLEISEYGSADTLISDLEDPEL